MKAVVLTPDRKIALEDRPVREPGRGEILIASEYCGICGTDLHAADLDLFAPPVTIGHEFSGVIAAIGHGVTGWNIGDRVTVNPNGNTCGVCEACRTSRTNLCKTAVFDNGLGVRRDGGMAEFATVPAVHLHRLPDSVDSKRGAWTEPLAVAIRAVRGSGIRLGDSAVVIGGGPIGLLTVQLLRRAGAARIDVVEPSGFRGDVAMSIGADAVYTPATLAEAVACGDFRPVDRVYECSGNPTAVQTAITLLSPGGTVQLIGVAAVPVAFSAMDALTKEITISANFIYAEEFDQAIELLSRDAVDVISLTSTVLTLDQHEAAFAALRRPDSTIKALIKTGTGD
ncbi:zinc-binding dehydrogenase [Streptomyces sp. NPDC007983]|uniref:zinc-dependent alcohol dehydrogenase n=1 Tax=Streptomyces sp. NPDC007983 TaxID=3364800 RepID=UPI0036F12B22